MKIQPAKSLRGKIALPGDKSISHRAAILSAMATGKTRIENFATGADCASTLNCLQSLGVEIKRENSTIFVKGVSKKGFQKSKTALDCGNSGTTLRLLAGVLAGQNFDSVLTGDESLQKRPMRRIVEPLTEMGAKIQAENNCAPLAINGRNSLESVIYQLPVASAQVKSCILLAGLNARGKTEVRSPPITNYELQVPNSRNHTELMLQYLGAEIEENFVETENGFVHQVLLEGNSKLTANNLQIPSDISSAAFFIIAAACLKNSEIVLQNVGLNPTRTAIIEVLRGFGAEIEVLYQREICNETVGDLLVRRRKNFAPGVSSNIIGREIIANIIDEIPILAIFGTQIENGLEIRGAQELRVKESDRIAAIVENLRKMNADVEEFPDGFLVKKSNLKGAQLNSFGDHRIAMAFSIAALFATGETEIAGAECASVSFPEFFQVLRQISK